MLSFALECLADRRDRRQARGVFATGNTRGPHRNRSVLSFCANDCRVSVLAPLATSRFRSVWVWFPFSSPVLTWPAGLAIPNGLANLIAVVWQASVLVAPSCCRLATTKKLAATRAQRTLPRCCGSGKCERTNPAVCAFAVSLLLCLGFPASVNLPERP